MTTSNAFLASSLLGATPDGVPGLPLPDGPVCDEDGVMCGEANGLGTSGMGDASAVEPWPKSFGVNGSDEGGGEM